MKKITGILFVLTALFVFVNISAAQIADVPTPERQAERMTEVMSKRLDLSEQQTQQVLDLNLKLAQKEAELLNNEELDFFERLEMLKGISTTRAEKLRDILNDQQYEKYHSLNHFYKSTLKKN